MAIKRHWFSSIKRATDGDRDMKSNNFRTNEEDILWGADRIGEALGMTERAVQGALRSGQIPGRKVGKTWCASRKALRDFFAYEEAAA